MVEKILAVEKITEDKQQGRRKYDRKTKANKAKFHSGHESLSIGLVAPTSKVDLGVMPFKICAVHNITPDIQISYVQYVHQRT